MIDRTNKEKIRHPRENRILNLWTNVRVKLECVNLYQYCPDINISYGIAYHYCIIKNSQIYLWYYVIICISENSAIYRIVLLSNFSDIPYGVRVSGGCVDKNKQESTIISWVSDDHQDYLTTGKFCSFFVFRYFIN